MRISFTTIPVLLEYLPVRREARMAAHTGVTTTALLKFIPSLANRSRFGVMAVRSPAYPTLSCRSWSAKIKTIFGRVSGPLALLPERHPDTRIRRNKTIPNAFLFFIVLISFTFILLN
jgi:hypothetical protein